MLKLQSKRTYIFRHPTSNGEKTFTVRPTGIGEFVTAPEWVKTDPLYDLALRDGNLIEVEVKTPPPAPPAPKDDEDEDGEEEGVEDGGEEVAAPKPRKARK